jgi:hypothetical protein
MCIDVQRRRRVPMAEPTRDCPNVDAGTEQLRGNEVTEVVESDVGEPLLLAEALEASGYRVREPGHRAVGVVAEHERVRVEREPAHRCVREHSDVVIGEHGHGLVVERDSSCSMGLGVLLDESVRPVDDASANGDGSIDEIDVESSKGDDLGASCSGRS